MAEEVSKEPAKRGRSTKLAKRRRKKSQRRADTVSPETNSWKDEKRAKNTAVQRASTKTRNV